MLFSRLKRFVFRAKAHLLFHWCLYNQFVNTTVRCSAKQTNEQRFYDTEGQTLFTLLPFAVFVLGDCGQNNRRITFLTPVSGFYLQGHVISNHSGELNLDCQDQCAFARECVSYNIGPMINNKMTCELSRFRSLAAPKRSQTKKRLDLQRHAGNINMRRHVIMSYEMP